MKNSAAFQQCLFEFSIYSVSGRYPLPIEFGSNERLRDAATEIKRIITVGDISHIKGWMTKPNGFADAKNGMSLPSFIALLKSWGGKLPALTTIEDIRYFAFLGCKDFIGWSHSLEFERFCIDRGIPNGKLSEYWKNIVNSTANDPIIVGLQQWIPQPKNHDVVQAKKLAQLVHNDPVATRILLALASLKNWDWKFIEQEVEKELRFDISSLYVPEIKQSVLLAMRLMDPVLKESFLRLGALEELSSYKFRDFVAVWKMDEHQASQQLQKLVALNLVCKSENEILTIHKEILEIAHQQFLDLPRSTQKHSAHWAERILSKKEFSEQFERSIRTAPKKSRTALKNWRKKLGIYTSNIFTRFALTIKSVILPKHDSDWDGLEIYFPDLSSDDYLLAKYLLWRSTKRVVQQIGVLALAVPMIILRQNYFWLFPFFTGVMLSANLLHWAFVYSNREEYKWLEIWDKAMQESKKKNLL